jgi:hypothetical protein
MRKPHCHGHDGLIVTIGDSPKGDGKPHASTVNPPRQTGTLLQSGAVLIAGGYLQGGAGASHALTSAELCQ